MVPVKSEFYTQVPPSFAVYKEGQAALSYSQSSHSSIDPSSENCLSRLYKTVMGILGSIWQWLLNGCSSQSASSHSSFTPLSTFSTSQASANADPIPSGIPLAQDVHRLIQTPIPGNDFTFLDPSKSYAAYIEIVSVGMWSKHPFSIEAGNIKNLDEHLNAQEEVLKLSGWGHSSISLVFAEKLDGDSWKFYTLQYDRKLDQGKYKRPLQAIGPISEQGAAHLACVRFAPELFLQQTRLWRNTNYRK